MHNGVLETLAQFKTRFYTEKARQKIKHMIHTCIICKKLEGKAFDYPKYSNLPDFRFIQSPFSSIGIDYAGPFLVKNVYGETNENYKCWIALITCMSSRAIHLDIAKNYDSQACCDVLKRFCSNFGYPEIVVSDNGTSFKGPEVQDFAANNNIKWKFNLEKAPWQGGVFERLIKSVKRCLTKVIGNKKLKYDELLTLIKQVQRIINNRPLTYCYEDEIVLTPNNLIYGKRIDQNLVKNNISEETDNEIHENVKNVDRILDHFWKRWSSEYLIELRDIHRKSKKNGVNDEIKIGDVVLIEEDKQKRSNWRTGRVDEIIISKDGQIRGVGLTTTTKEGTGRLKRSLNKLYPFIKSRNDIENENDEPAITFISDENVENIPVGGV